MYFPIVVLDIPSYCRLVNVWVERPGHSFHSSLNLDWFRATVVDVVGDGRGGTVVDEYFAAVGIESDVMGRSVGY